MMQQKMASCKDKAMDLRKGKNLLKPINHKDKASVGINSAWKVVTAVLDTGAGWKLLKENCLLQEWVRNVILMKATRLRSAANKQLEVNELVRMGAQLGQRVAEEGFRIVTNLATDMILGTAYIDENIKKISPRKNILRPTGSSTVTLDGSVDNVASMADSLESKQEPFK